VFRTPVNVPVEVTGLFETVNMLGRDKPTEVTTPESFAAIVIVLPEGVSVIPVPAAKVTAPLRPLIVVTPVAVVVGQ
jgi:hypothetical protein